MQPMLNIAIRAARHAEDLIVRKINKPPDLQVEIKAENAYVSEAEARIIKDLLKDYPRHGILAEESGEIEGQEDFRWMGLPITCMAFRIFRFQTHASTMAG